MRFLIAPWGNFSSWGGTKYILFDNGESTFSRTSLKLLKDFLKPDVTVILIPDSLFNGRAESYSDIEKEVLAKTKDFLKSEGLDGIEIKILPGNYKGVIHFQGDLKDYYYLALYEIVKVLMNGVDRGVKDLEVILDLTHGVNFMPVMIYEALRQILQLMGGFFNTVLETYNSEPYRKDIDELYVYRIRREEFYFSLSYYLINFEEVLREKSLSGNIMKPLGILNSAQKSEVGKKRGEFYKKMSLNFEDLNAFLISTREAMLLGVYSFFVEPDDVQTVLEDIVRFYYEMIEVEENSVVRKISLDMGFETIVKVWVISKLMKSVFGVRRKRKVTIEELKKLHEGFVKRMGMSKYYIIANELSNLEKLARSRQMRGTYAEFQRLKASEPSKDPRIYIAHAGFEKNLTFIDSTGDEIVISYTDLEHFRKVLKNISR